MDSSPKPSAHQPRPGPIVLGILGGAVAGIAANLLLGPDHEGLQTGVRWITDPVGQLFLRLLLLLVVPLVFASLVLGVAGLGEIKKLGRIGIKSFAYCLLISAISVGLALSLSNLIQPGKRLDPEVAKKVQERYATAAASEVSKASQTTTTDSPTLQLIKTVVPKSPVAAVAGETPNLLHWMFFSLLIGVGITLLPVSRTEALTNALQSLLDICIQLIGLIMKAAPVAVACLVFTNLALFGLDLLQALGWFVFSVLLGLSLQQFGVYSFMVRVFAGRSPLDFFRKIRIAMLTAFSTSSSNATLPTTLEISEKGLGIPREIGSFVLTVGATANQNGTALYEGMTILFLAQLTGLDLSLGQQMLVAGLAILGSMGTAGVPSASIPFIVVVAASLGINPGLVAVILGVDRFLDMCRTVVNVTGDLTAAAYVARSEARQSQKAG